MNIELSEQEIILILDALEIYQDTYFARSRLKQINELIQKVDIYYDKFEKIL